MTRVRGSGAGVAAKPRLGAARRGPQRARAVAISLAIHAAFFLFAFATASGDLVSAAGSSGGPSGPVFAVTLVRAAPTATPGTQASPEVQALLAKLRATSTDDPLAIPTAERSRGFASLAERLRSQQPHATPAHDPAAPPEAARQGSPHSSANELSGAQRLADAKSDEDGDTTGSPSTGRLWGLVEPCWRNLGPRGRVPVVLEVSLDAAADLRVPPRVIRSTTALIDEQRLQAESSALAALAACIPRGDLRFGRKTYRLEFPAIPSP